MIHKEEITFCVPDVRVFPVDIFLSASKQWFISYFTSLDGYYISRNTCLLGYIGSQGALALNLFGFSDRLLSFIFGRISYYIPEIEGLLRRK